MGHTTTRITDVYAKAAPSALRRAALQRAASFLTAFLVGRPRALPLARRRAEVEPSRRCIVAVRVRASKTAGSQHSRRHSIRRIQRVIDASFARRTERRRCALGSSVPRRVSSRSSNAGALSRACFLRPFVRDELSRVGTAGAAQSPRRGRARHEERAQITVTRLTSKLLPIRRCGVEHDRARPPQLRDRRAG
jgi:hypothetical protein